MEYEPTEEALRKAITHRTAACVARPETFFPVSVSRFLRELTPNQ
eukprot:SAG31_NODE_25755_length_455_cov_0.575843_2_plen_44_part_01